MITALLFIASLILVVVASELFTNAIEWAGYVLNLGTGATGSLLAALGTSLPETVVPIVALATHSPAADSVATGAVLGSPFLLLTLGAGATGVAVVLRGGARKLVIDRRQARRDLGVFLGAFTVAVLSSVLPSGARIVVGALLLLAYAMYVIATLRGSAIFAFGAWIFNTPFSTIAERCSLSTSTGRTNVRSKLRSSRS